MKDKNNKTVNKRVESLKEYVDALQENYSKLNSVRIDFGYKKPHSEDITLNDIKADVNHLLSNRRSKKSIFEHNVGYIIKTEHGESKGMHGHAVFFFDGNKVQKDTFKGTQIGEYWNDQITKGKGSFHNCNSNTYDDNGVGMLDHKDTEKRKSLDNALSYLCKDSQDLKDKKDSNKDKAFTRGLIPRKKGNIGRPRKESKK